MGCLVSRASVGNGDKTTGNCSLPNKIITQAPHIMGYDKKTEVHARTCGCVAPLKLIGQQFVNLLIIS